MKPENILLDLVAIPSVSAMANEPVIQYAEKHLAGWTLKRFRYRDAAGVEKINLVAKTKPGVAELALVCHTDIVPYPSSWGEAVNPVIRGGKTARPRQLRREGFFSMHSFGSCAGQSAEPRQTPGDRVDGR